MNKYLLKGSFVFLFVVLFLVIVYFILFATLKKAEPEYSGTITCENLRGDTEIYFDSTAIPYICASNTEDAAYAMGYLHARERLFQMDLMRRAGEGRLSEVLGEKTVAFDQMFLTIGIKRIAEQIYQNASPLTKKMLTAYSAGVNEFLHAKRDKLPVEFDVLGYDPYDWKPEHSIMIIRLMAWELNISWWSDYAYTEIVQALGREKAMKLLPDFPENGPVIIPSKLTAFEPGVMDFLNTDKAFRSFMGMPGTHIGSNNWVLNGNKTVSGKPMIANDPHLTFQTPGKWYFCCVRAGEWNAEGVTLPGVPVVVIGKNQSIAWALTNVMADDADFYVDSLDQNRTSYWYDGQWRKLRKVVDTIQVKGIQPVIHESFLTHRGPIVSGVQPYGKLFRQGVETKSTLSMRWMGSEISDEYSGFYALNTARSFGDFKKGVSQFTVPGQNFVYADRQGNIGYVCGAKLPMRKSVSPLFFYDGTRSDQEWQGFVPFSDMPELYNPQQNYIASANNKTVASFPYYISNLWEPASRITRIKQLVESKERLSLQDCEDMQMDVKSPYAEEIVQYLLAAFKGMNIKDDNLRMAIQLLQKWDYKFDKDAQTPAIYAMFFEYLLQNTLKDDLGESLYNEFVFVANIPYRVMERLLKENTSEIFDDIRTPQKETREMVLRKSLVDALSRLERLYGKDIKNWQWGNLHHVTFKHAFHGNSSVADHIVDIGPFPIGGDGTTICNSEYHFFQYNGDIPQFKSKPFDDVLGPSMRYLYDFSNPDVMLFVQPTGQSGITTSIHYKDMTEAWLNGKYFSIRTDNASIQKNTNKLTLTPKR